MGLIQRIARSSGAALTASATPGGIRRRVSSAARRASNAFSAFYESAQPGGDDQAHWTMAGSFSARQINSPAVRETLRNRARYEVANNSMARGVVDTLADDLIGDGPAAQLASDPFMSRDDAQRVERAWNDWAARVGLWRKLRTGRKAISHDGEIFYTFTTNERIGPVSLDLTLVETERVANPFTVDLELDEIDGIKFDSANNPIRYRVLDHHPDDLHLGIEVDGYKWIEAEDVIHYFRQDRAGQARGIPELTPALPCFAQLRRYTESVLKAARSAANISKVIHTDNPIDGEDGTAAEPYDEIIIPDNAALVLPDGYKLGGFKAEQPTTTFGDFRRQIANEIGRCLSMPVNLVLADSSQHNYASGKLDHSTYFHKLRVDRQELRDIVLDRIFQRWLAEAVLVSGLLPESARRARPPIRPSWTWPARQHADPSKEATAMDKRLTAGVTSLVEECAANGHDWQDVLENRKKVADFAKALGIELQPSPPRPEARPPASPAGSGPGTSQQQEDDDE